MSLLSEYEARTAWKYEPIRGCFHTHAGLTAKVDESGKYRRFPGSTSVFRLERDERFCIAAMQSYLHDRAGEMLARPLPVSTLHMTLHDLANPETAKDGSDCAKQIDDSLTMAAGIVEDIRREYAGRRIAMAADRVVNMVSKSVVLMLRPQTEADFALLTALYRRFDAVVPLPWPLTPHITLAYFKPGMIDGDRLAEAVARLQQDPGDPLPLNLSVSSLTAQRFESMAHYEDVPLRICFCCDGGMNRSVMAAAMLNHRARAMGLPVQCEARAAFPDTDGAPIPEAVRTTLRRHGIDTDALPERARALSLDDDGAFSGFAALSEGALDRVCDLNAGRSKISRYFFGVPDPQYETTYENAFYEIEDGIEYFLNDFARFRHL